MNKPSIIIYSLSLIVGFFGQIIFAILVWNNESLFIYHWIFGMAGIVIAFFGMFYNLIKLS